jgi:aminoglycoside N3'-acetyltransferase
MWKTDKLKSFLNKIHIKEDFIIIHSDITGLVFPKFNLAELWKIIFDVFGHDKTYIFPAFSFNTNKKNIWSYNKTKSDAGILSEYFRKQISSTRTVHPVHSVCFFGKNENKIPIKYCSTSFGKNSFWEWACNNKNVCNISLGLELQGGATFCHYAEEYCRVPYRKFVDLNFLVKDKKNNLIKKKYKYFARNIISDTKVANDWDRVQKILIHKKLLKVYKNEIPKFKILKMNTFKVTNFLINKIKKDPNFLLKYYL